MYLPNYFSQDVIFYIYSPQQNKKNNKEDITNFKDLFCDIQYRINTIFFAVLFAEFLTISEIEFFVRY